jgi:hypothetical protein
MALHSSYNRALYTEDDDSDGDIMRHIEVHVSKRIVIMTLRVNEHVSWMNGTRNE